MARSFPRSVNPFLRSFTGSLSSRIALFSTGRPSAGRLAYQPNGLSRTFHHSSPVSQSLLARFSRWTWYKKDGFTPRSKKRGLVITVSLSVTFLLLYSAISLLWEVEDLVLLLAAFIQLEQIDSSSYYPSEPSSDTKERNWDDWTESTLYFKSICKPVLVTLTWAAPEHVDRFFAELEDVVRDLELYDKSLNPSNTNDAESLKTKIHSIMNSASHSVHQSLTSLKSELSNPDTYSLSRASNSSRLPSADTGGAETTIERASEVVQHIREAVEAILHALQERVDRHKSGEIDKELSGWFKVKGDGSGSGRSSKGKGYDIIG